MNPDIQTRLARIEQAILNYIEEDQMEPAQLREVAYHLVKAGGKRLRSLIVLLACEAVGGNFEDALPLVIAAEFLQTASLIHDDIIDQDVQRRGVPTVHTKYGLEYAILASDYLIFKAYSIISGYGDPKLLRIISEAGVSITRGETTELFMKPEVSSTFNREQYLSMAQEKTGAFIEGAAKSGALIGEATKVQLHALTQYGRNIGLAFQIRDDILDITELHQPQQLMNSDLHLRRANLTLILAFETCSEHEQKQCLQALEQNNYNAIQAILEKTNALNRAQMIAQSYVEKAKAALKEVNLLHHDILEQLANLVLIRTI
jgi:geranylgeranyl pyrophosphate synthase